MKATYLLSIIFFFSCENNKIINSKALIPLENPAISAYIDVDKNEISVFISTITAFEEKYSFANSVIKDAKVYAKKANGGIINIPFIKNNYLSTISVFSGETIELNVEWQGKKYKATTTIPNKTVFGEVKKVDSEIYTLEILNPSKEMMYNWVNKKATNETQNIVFSLLFPDKYIFPLSDSVTNLSMKIVLFDKNLPNTSPLYLPVNLISIDKNLFDYQTISTNSEIDTRGAIKNSPIINNFDNGAVGFFGSLINTEVKIRIN